MKPEQRDWKKEAEVWMEANEFALEWNKIDIEEVIEIMRGLLTEPEDEHWVKVPYCNKCGGEHLTEEHATEPEDDIPAGYKCAKCKKRLSECTCTDADWLKVKHEFGKDFTCNLNSGGSSHAEPEDECCLDYDPECGCKICERQKIIEGILVSNKVNDDVYGDEILLGDRFPVVAREIANALNAHTEPEDEHYKLFKHDGSSAKVIKTAKDEVLDACKVCGEPYWRQPEASE